MLQHQLLYSLYWPGIKHSLQAFLVPFSQKWYLEAKPQCWDTRCYWNNHCGGPFQWADLGTIYFQGKIRNSLWYFNLKSGQVFYLMFLVLHLYFLSSTLRVLAPKVTETIELEYRIIAHLFFTHRIHRTVTE